MVQQKPRSVDSKSRGWWTNITICFGDFNLLICRDNAQNSPDLLVESSTWEGKTPFEVPNGNGEFFNFFLYCHNCRPMAQNPNWGVGSRDWVQERKLSSIRPLAKVRDTQYGKL
ncbi:hypothetical protein [Nostoc sp. 'Lobaria pulmonaria (5183) cyanobiont']|uniref:hypothetical protein n=1 Tax=Nostoc sp. 'Lobaria pulmonaria (5183) cyanobiont' TaxID=1618022 RepID=UPI000CF30001|nr:hypothetical protein [Nostoc sp. 'Lobaria pulmonaria (5183) cyanobiont']